jgi:hypothetical protein
LLQRVVKVEPKHSFLTWRYSIAKDGSVNHTFKVALPIIHPAAMKKTMMIAELLINIIISMTRANTSVVEV